MTPGVTAALLVGAFVLGIIAGVQASHARIVASDEARYRAEGELAHLLRATRRHGGQL